ncbi:MAG: AMP-binding protein, partial [Deltaproteobacteria bacterium]|nr:AMP-binding protein [Deltaproteobacteria bacterium]
MNLSEIVDRFAMDLPDHPALVYEDRTISYAELLGMINAVSNALVKAGVQKGDRVVTLMGNRLEFVAGYFAAVRIGGIAVTLNPLSTVYELSNYLADCRPAAVLCKGDQVAKIDSLRDRLENLKIVVSTETADGAVS